MRGRCSRALRLAAVLHDRRADPVDVHVLRAARLAARPELLAEDRVLPGAGVAAAVRGGPVGRQPAALGERAAEAAREAPPGPRCRARPSRARPSRAAAPRRGTPRARARKAASSGDQSNSKGQLRGDGRPGDLTVLRYCSPGSARSTEASLEPLDSPATVGAWIRALAERHGRPRADRAGRAAPALRRGRGRLGAPRPRAPRARRREGRARRRAVSERPRLGGGVARRGAHRRGRRADQHLLPGTRARLRAAPRRRPGAAPGAALPLPRLPGAPLEIAPGLGAGAAAPHRAPRASAPATRVRVRRPPAPRAGRSPSRRSSRRPATTRSCARSRRRSRAADPLADPLQLRQHRRPEGRGARPRRGAAPLPARSPARATSRRRTASGRRCRSSGWAASSSRCSATSTPGACTLCEEVVRPGGARSRFLERERATLAIGWPHFGKALRGAPEPRRARSLGAARRQRARHPAGGGLPEGSRAPRQRPRHDGDLRAPHLGRPGAAPRGAARLLRHGAARDRAQGGRSRERRAVAGRPDRRDLRARLQRDAGPPQGRARARASTPTASTTRATRAASTRAACSTSRDASAS